MTFLLMREDGEVEEILGATLPEAIERAQQILPKHTKLYFDGDLHEAFKEYYDAEEYSFDMPRAANPRPQDQRPPADPKTKEWEGPDEEMPEAAMKALGIGRIDHRAVLEMTDQEAYRRLRPYFYDNWPPEERSQAYSSWTKLTAALLSSNFKTAKAEAEARKASPAMQRATAKRTREAMARKRVLFEKEYKEKMATYRKELAERNKLLREAKRRGEKLKLPALRKPSKQKPIPQTKTEKKPVILYDPETGESRQAPFASSKGLGLMPYTLVTAFSQRKGLFSQNGGVDPSTGKRVLPIYGQKNYGVCIGSTPLCRPSCLVTTGSNLKTAWSPTVKGIRTEALLREPVAFARALHVAINKHEATTTKAGMECAVRLNVYSDIPWELLYPEIFSEHPNVQFYDYTKVAGRNISQIPNYHLTFSYGGTERTWKRAWREFHLRGRQIAIVFNLEKDDKMEDLVIDGHKVWDGDLHDHRYWEPSPAIIGLRFKLPKQAQPEAEKILTTDVQAVRSMKQRMARERMAAARAGRADSYFIVQMEKDPSTGKWVGAPTPRLLGADDYMELPPPGSEEEARMAAAEGWDEEAQKIADEASEVLRMMVKAADEGGEEDS